MKSNESTDEKYMRRCLELAVQGLGSTYPNPVVGAVIVWKDRILGEGFHLRAGEPHAEVHALRAVKEKELLKEATLYVTLEPCSHHGRTPPCADRIIQYQIPRVVVGCEDSSSKVAGKGIRKMREAGIEVLEGICRREARHINRRFFTFHEEKRPYIILKWAASRDGFLDQERTPETPVGVRWITGPYGKSLVHRWRSEEASVLVGGETVRLDNPRLNIREWTGAEPLKLILSRSGNLPEKPAVTKGKELPWLFTTNRDIQRKDCRILLIPEQEQPLPGLLGKLYEQQVQSVFVEGGRRILDFFLKAGLWDEARVFEGPQRFGAGVKAPELNLSGASRHQLPGSILYLKDRHS